MVTDIEQRPAGPTEVGTGRIEAFSDSVMAVIITIMAFELRPPHGVDLAAVREQLPGLLVYVLSFVMVGMYWNNHHQLMRTARRINAAVMWANLLLLFWLSLIPVLTEWLRDDYRYSLPAATYGAAALLAAFAFNVLVRTLIRANGRDSAIARAIGSDLKGKTSIALYGLGIVGAFISPWIAYGAYVAVAVMWFIPDSRFTRSIRA